MIYRASAPANIALIKYWGKGPSNTALNASVSMSLGHCRTITEVCVASSSSSSSSSCDEVQFAHTALLQDIPLHDRNREGKKEAQGENWCPLREAASTTRTLKFLQYIKDLCGVQVPLQVRTCNTFPAHCGIASSASGFAALTLATVACLLQAPTLEALQDQGFCLHTLANISRHGSGSSCRSFWPGYVSWQPHPHDGKHLLQWHQEASQWALTDTIFVINTQAKHVSSSAGHLRAQASPYFSTRLKNISQRYPLLLEALHHRDLSALGPLMEADALDMHKVAHSSTPPIFYGHQDSWRLIRWLQQQRLEQRLHAYFTMDAGANVHVISSQGSHDSKKIIAQAQKHVSWQYTIHDHTATTGPQLSTRPT